MINKYKTRNFNVFIRSKSENYGINKIILKNIIGDH